MFDTCTSQRKQRQFRKKATCRKNMANKGMTSTCSQEARLKQSMAFQSQVLLKQLLRKKNPDTIAVTLKASRQRSAPHFAKELEDT